MPSNVKALERSVYLRGLRQTKYRWWGACIFSLFDNLCASTCGMNRMDGGVRGVRHSVVGMRISLEVRCSSSMSKNRSADL